ncbi:hypothetical protein ACMGD3_10725 [Lysinibacillus sphaericus]|uniref:hypothetical protein n=1 Tax=Lysinibacillus sphaericus TaxID=1421 RepID=UPI003F79BABD
MMSAITEESIFIDKVIGFSDELIDFIDEELIFIDEVTDSLSTQKFYRRIDKI